ncbi:tyrosine-type recombinase/integrase [Salipiger mucosus]|uniref:tyrosine-type recombinase/integrase n=1 Tax=Salipiger mucosus TaxID=263378 RepID=UPI0018DCF9A1|nr:site-specific integrase [Salipiger mucosus]
MNMRHPLDMRMDVTMASVRERSNGKYCVQIRLAGHKPISKTFSDYETANEWARIKEQELSSATSTPEVRPHTLLTLGQHYCNTQLKGKPSRHHMLGRIERIAQHFPQSFLQIKRTDVNAYKVKRLQEASGPTVREEIQTINKLFRWAEREMIFGEAPVHSPASNIALPSASKPRSRVVERSELDTLLMALNPLMAEIVELAYETAMRRAEITKLIPRHLSLGQRVLVVEDGKTGDRIVPLTSRAIDLLRSACERCRTPETRLYPVAPHSISTAIRRARERTGLPDHVRMHQMRHTRITEVARRGFNQAQIMMVSGHRDTRSVHRYTHLSVKDVVDLLE